MRRLALALLVLPRLTMAEVRPVAPSPESCTPLLTVRKTNCAVEHVYRCADGATLNMATSDGGKLRYSSLSDAEYVPLSANTSDGSAMAFGAPDGDIRFSQLRSTGAVTATIPVSLWLLEFVDPFRGSSSMRGQVTERTYTADGHALTRTRWVVDLSLNNGGIQTSSEGDGYHDQVSGAQFGGSGEEKVFGTLVRKWVEDPVALIYPGEAGFMNDLSEIECDPVGSLAPVTTEPLGRG